MTTSKHKMTEISQLITQKLFVFLIILPDYYKCKYSDNDNFNRFEESKELIAEWNKINNFVYDLDYNETEIVYRKWESGKMIKDSMDTVLAPGGLVKVSSNLNYKSISGDLSVTGANIEVTYPGALLLADTLMDEIPTEVKELTRNTLRYRIDLPGLIKESVFTAIPSYTKIKSRIQNILKDWLRYYSEDYKLYPDPEVVNSFAQSKRQLQSIFGGDLSYYKIDKAINYKAIKHNKLLVMIHKVKFIYYTVYVDSPFEPGDLFLKGVKLSQVEKEFNVDHPPIMVSSRSYGKVIYIKTSTTSINRFAKSYLINNLTQIFIDPSYKGHFSEKLKNLKIKVFVPQGKKKKLLRVETTKIKKIHKILERKKIYSKKDLGFPFLYDCEFIKTNTRVIIQELTEKDHKKKIVIHKPGYIYLKHTGAFAAKFVVEWDEITYGKHNKEIRNHKKWPSSGNIETGPWNATIKLPGNAEDISVTAEEVTGIHWEGVQKKLIKCIGFSLLPKRYFTLSGTILDNNCTVKPLLDNCCKHS